MNNATLLGIPVFYTDNFYIGHIIFGDLSQYILGYKQYHHMLE
jgi:hypothetical protein